MEQRWPGGASYNGRSFKLARNQHTEANRLICINEMQIIFERNINISVVGYSCYGLTVCVEYIARMQSSHVVHAMDTSVQDTSQRHLERGRRWQWSMVQRRHNWRCCVRREIFGRRGLTQSRKAAEEQTADQDRSDHDSMRHYWFGFHWWVVLHCVSLDIIWNLKISIIF